MGKRKSNQQWLVVGEFYGGPADGERLEIGVIGHDPVSAFGAAVERDDVPERLEKLSHFYEIAWESVQEVTCESGSCATFRYWYCGLRLGGG